ncbi:hypothetical protein CSC81_18025, partial [Tenacibaculum discolor]
HHGRHEHPVAQMPQRHRQGVVIELAHDVRLELVRTQPLTQAHAQRRVGRRCQQRRAIEAGREALLEPAGQGLAGIKAHAGAPQAVVEGLHAHVGRQGPV